MSNIDSIISVVKSQLSAYDVGNVLDEDHMYRTIVLSLKGFGNDATEMHEDIVKVKGGMAELPKNFYSLYEVRECCPDSYDNHGKDIEVHHVMDTQFYGILKELKTSWNTCENCCQTDEVNFYRKELIYKDNFKVTCNYRKGKPIRITKGMVRNDCAKACAGLTRSDCVEEVSVIQNKLYANFNEADLYIKYRGFLTDDTGSMLLIDTPNGSMERYIENNLKVEMAMILMGNKENVQGLATLLPIWMQEKEKYRLNASRELKMKSLNPDKITGKIESYNRNYMDAVSLRKK